MQERLHSWRDWYRLAHETLGYEPPEATEYANLRYAEELNRDATEGHVEQEPPLTQSPRE